MSMHHPDMEYTWVRSIPQIEGVIWSNIEIEDFYGNTHRFYLEKYQTDRLFVKVLDWDSIWAVIELDLGTNSNIPSPVMKIRSQQGVEIFSQQQEIADYLDWEWESTPEPIDIDRIVWAERERYRQILSQIPEGSLQPGDEDVFIRDLTKKWLFTRDEVMWILGLR